MKTAALLIAVTCVFGASLWGCSAGSQPMDNDYLKSGEATGKERRDAFLQAGGDYSKLDATHKATYLKGFKNDEIAAKAYWEQMQHPRGGAPAQQQAPAGPPQ